MCATAVAYTRVNTLGVMIKNAKEYTFKARKNPNSGIRLYPWLTIYLRFVSLLKSSQCRQFPIESRVVFYFVNTRSLPILVETDKPHTCSTCKWQRLMLCDGTGKKVTKRTKFVLEEIIVIK